MADSQPIVPVVDAPAAAVPVAPAPEPSARRSSFADFDEAETGKDLARLTGKPAPTAPSAPVAPTADPDDAPALDAKGAPVTGTDGKPLSKRQQDANRRIQEAIDRGLSESRERLAAAERRAAELETRLSGSQPPAPSPAAKPTATDDAPTLDQFVTEPDPYLAFGKAHAEWVVKKALKAEADARADLAQREAGDKAVRDRIATYQQREDALKATVPDFDAKTRAVRDTLDLRSPLTQALLESPAAAHLVLHFAEHPDDFQRIGALGVTHPSAALRELGRLEAIYDTGRSPAAAAPAPPAASPAPELISKAPAPGTYLGNRPAPAADSSKAAVVKGDFRAFQEAEDAKALAAVGRR